MSSNDVGKIYGLLAFIDNDLDIPKKALGVLGNAFKAKVQNDIERFQRLEQAIREATRDKTAENVAALNKKIDKYNARLDALEKDFKLKDQRTRDRVFAMEKQFPTTKKQANDALYEAREGRKKLESQIAESRKLGNDALYEVRQGRERIESQIAESRKLGNDALYEVRQGRERIESEINQLSRETQSAIDKIQITFNDDLRKLQNQIINIPKAAEQNTTNPRDINSLIDSKISSLESRLNSNAQQAALANAISQAIAAESKKQESNLNNQNIYQYDKLSKKLDADFQQKIRENELFLFKGKNPFESLDKIAQETERLNREFNQLATLQSKAAQGDKEAAAEVDRRMKADIDKFWQDINNKNRNLSPIIAPDIARELKPLADRIKKLEEETKKSSTPIDVSDIERRLREREEVDKQYAPLLPAINAKLDQIIPTIAGIPIIVGRIPSTIAPMIPTIPQIGNIVQDKVCNPQCQLPSISAGNNAANAANNANNNIGNKLDGLKNGADAAAQAAQLALLETINKKMGAEITGGLSGKLVDGFKWLQIDRALNVLIFVATVHNAFMISNDIGQTLLGAINNGLTLIGLKDDKGQAFNIGEAINGTVENTLKGILGADNYTQIRENWAKANRVYQATTNVLNSFLSLTQTVLQASEMIAAYTGKIGNALRKGGVILENAYGWMNPQPKFNRVTQTLESFQNGASTIQMVTQAPLDIVNATTEFNNSATEFVKAVKEDDKPQNKAVPQPEPDELKAKETQAKTDSQPSPFDFFDLFDGED